MKVTKQQKILGGVLVLGMIAVTADHFIRGTPAPAVAETSEVVAAQPQAKTAAVALAPAKPAGPSIAQRLRSAGRGYTDREVNDAFAMGVVWHTPEKAPAVQVDQSAQRFHEMHHLTVTLTSGGTGLAMVDGKIIAVGKELDGFKLVSISHRSATFESAGSKIILYLNEHNATETATASE